MPKQDLSLADVEHETDRFLMPTTEKERDILRAAIDLVRRVLAPTILRTSPKARMETVWGAARRLGGSLGRGRERPLFISERFAGLAVNPPVARVFFGELTRNPALCNDLAHVWRPYLRNPMLATVTEHIAARERRCAMSECRRTPVKTTAVQRQGASVSRQQ
jgi:hypothetical protein